MRICEVLGKKTFTDPLNLFTVGKNDFPYSKRRENAKEAFHIKCKFRMASYMKLKKHKFSNMIFITYVNSDDNISVIHSHKTGSIF